MRRDLHSGFVAFPREGETGGIRDPSFLRATGSIWCVGEKIQAEISQQRYSDLRERPDDPPP